LARQLNVELSMVTPSGPDGVITASDVQRVAKILSEVGPPEILRGVRRAMAQNMALAQSEVAAATVIDDADIHAWAPGNDITIRPEELRGNTITLSNFGMIGGKYAAPIVMPPTVAILGAGRIHDQVVAVDGAPAVHRVLPLSLTFDHRVVTGGEAARFMTAVI